MYFSITWERSEWDGKINVGMEERSACLAALSTFSWPRMPLWPGTEKFKDSATTHCTSE